VCFEEFALLSGCMRQLRNAIKLRRLRPSLSRLVSAEVPLLTEGLFLQKEFFKSVASPLYGVQWILIG